MEYWTEEVRLYVRLYADISSVTMAVPRDRDRKLAYCQYSVPTSSLANATPQAGHFRCLDATR
jgi:hypothetical protein